MKDHGRFIGVLEEQLPQDIDDGRHGNEGKHPNHAQKPHRLSRATLTDPVQDHREEGHRGNSPCVCIRGLNDGKEKQTNKKKKKGVPAKALAL